MFQVNISKYIVTLYHREHYIAIWTITMISLISLVNNRDTSF